MTIFCCLISIQDVDAILGCSVTVVGILLSYKFPLLNLTHTVPVIINTILSNMEVPFLVIHMT